MTLLEGLNDDAIDSAALLTRLESKLGLLG